MKFTAEIIFAAESSVKSVGGESIAQIARDAEEAGFDAISFNDHPAPSRKWLRAGGHDSHDPIAILSFCAAHTSRIRLIPYQLVLTYRNPFLIAKGFASLDVLSGGRAVASVCLGYLRSEFAALGVSFDERHERFEEALVAMKSIWTQPGVAMSGRGFEALDQTATPRPIQSPHPPIWIGGNSRRSREWVAKSAQGWAPLLLDVVAARTTRTALLSTYEDFERAMDELRGLMIAEGRDPTELEIQLGRGPQVRPGPDAEMRHIERLGSLGVTQYVAPFVVGGERNGHEEMLRFAEDIVGSAR